MRKEIESSEIHTKSEKRENVSRKLKKKQIKHGYGDFGEDNLKKQQLGVSRALKKILKKKIKVK